MSDNQLRSPASVDVAIPCYPYGGFMRDCVTSVLTQAIRDVRVLIIDNASTDDSVEVALQIAAEDPRVEVIARRRNLGPHASFNEGIDWARATYFLVLCADDLLAPGRSLQPPPGDRDPSPRALPVPQTKRAPPGHRGRVRDGAMVAPFARCGAGGRLNRLRHRSAPIPRSHGTYIHGSSIDAL